MPTGAPMASVKGPALVDGTVVFGSQNGHVYRVGSRRRCDRSGSSRCPTSSFSSPVVADGTVFVGGSDGLACLGTGRRGDAWTAAPGAPVRSSPAVVRRRRVRRERRHEPLRDRRGDGRRAVADVAAEARCSRRRRSARRRLRRQLRRNLLRPRRGDGRVRWQAPLGRPGVVVARRRRRDTVFVGGNDGGCTRSSGARDGDVAVRDERRGLVVAGRCRRVVYVGSFDGRVYAIDAEIGGERWRFDTGNVVFSSPKVEDGTVYVGSHSGAMYALDAADGDLDWRFETGAIVGTTRPSTTSAGLLRRPTTATSTPSTADPSLPRNLGDRGRPSHSIPGPTVGTEHDAGRKQH